MEETIMTHTYARIAPSLQSILTMSEAQLAALAAITDQPICIGQAPLIGRYGRIGTRRVAEREPKHEDLLIAYEWTETGELTRIYVGAAHTGPLLQWDHAGWRNCYGHGNHGGNGACGGTWSGNGAAYPSMLAALDARDYLVAGMYKRQAALREGARLLRSLRELAALEE